MPSWEIFEEQTQAYRDGVVPPAAEAGVAVEQASTFGLERYVGTSGRIVGMHAVGASAAVERGAGKVRLLDLRTALLARAHGTGFVFGIGSDGEPPPQEATSLRITRVMRKLRLHGVSHHTMRHTGITMMLEVGVSPRVIQKLARWTLRMLERYGHVRDAKARRAVSAMQSVIQKAVERPAEESTQQVIGECAEMGHNRGHRADENRFARIARSC